MVMKNLGFITDCLFHKLQGIVEEKDDYVLIKTPSNPGYHWVNLLFFENAPEEGCFTLYMCIVIVDLKTIRNNAESVFLILFGRTQINLP